MAQQQQRFKAQDKVVFVPVMTVVEYGTFAGVTGYRCEWSDGNGKHREAVFTEAELSVPSQRKIGVTYPVVKKGV